MKEAFFKLPSDKRQNILNEAYIEFTEKGYEKASTNVIAKKAEIGKGTLFYYFDNKKQFFNYLIETAFELTYKEYFNKINYEQTDFFERLVEVSQLKQRVYSQYSHAMGFISKVLLDTGEYDLSEKYNKKRVLVEKTWAELISKNIDYSKFREDLTQETTFNFIRWTLEGYRHELEHKFKQQGEFMMKEDEIKVRYAEYFNYIETLKKIYYKKDAIQ